MKRERKAAEMKESESNGPIADHVWKDVNPVLDDAISSLPARYRNVVVLYYLDGHTRREVAQEMGCPMKTIDTRLARALSKLRESLSRRGVVVSSVMLTSFLTARTVDAAPMHLVETLTAVTTGRAIPTDSVLSLTDGLLKTLFWVKVKLTAGIAMVVIVAGAVIGLGAHTLLAEEYVTAVPQDAIETAGESLLKEIEQLEKDTFPGAIMGWGNAQRDQDPLATVFSGIPKEDEAQAGVIPYKRPWCTYTTPRSAPFESERTDSFNCVATPGELEPISVSLYCLTDLSNIKGSISDLMGPETIPASTVTVYSIYQIPMPWTWEDRWMDGRPRTWERVPNLMLDVPGGLPGKAGESRQIIFDVEVPHDAKAGVYTGRIVIETDKGAVSREVNVQVLPFRLYKADEEWHRGMFGSPRNIQDARFQIKWGINSVAAWWWDTHFLFGTTHGKCNATGDILLAKDGEKEMIGPMLDIWKEAGFKHWVYFLMDGGFGNAVTKWWGIPTYPSPEYEQKYRSTLMDFRNALKTQGHIEPVFVANDEPTNPRYIVDRILNEMKWIDDVGGKNYCVVFRKDDPLLFAGKSFLQMWVSNNPSPEKLAIAKGSNCTLATYRGGHWQRKVAEVRFHFGYKSFWFDAPLTFSWTHDCNYGEVDQKNRLNDFAGGNLGAWHTSIFFDKERRPVPTLSMLAIREAIDDRLYLETLRKTGKAEDFLKKIKEQILERFKPEGPHKYKNVPDWADPWTYC